MLRSLVGSEMCIRDSGCRHPHPPCVVIPRNVRLSTRFRSPSIRRCRRRSGPPRGVPARGCGPACLAAVLPVGACSPSAVATPAEFDRSLSALSARALRSGSAGPSAMVALPAPAPGAGADARPAHVLHLPGQQGGRIALGASVTTSLHRKSSTDGTGSHRMPIWIRIATARWTPCLLYTSDAADEEDSVDLGG